MHKKTYSSSITAALLGAASIVSCLLPAAAAAGPKSNDLVFSTRFASAAERSAWQIPPSAEWTAAADGTHTLRVQVPQQGRTASNMASIPLEIAPYRGCRLLFECMATAKDVSKPSADYLGVKFMFHCKSPSTNPIWHNENGVFGTFDNRRLRFSVRIPDDAEGAALSLGLQDSSGTATFGDIKISVLEPPRPKRPAPMHNPPPPFKGHSLPRLRGVMSPNAFREDDIRVLGEDWNVNLIRWQITRNWGKAGTERDLAEYTKWINSKLNELDLALEACAKYGLKVVIDIHSPPGGRYENKDMAMFFEKEYQEYFVTLWERIARRYKGHRAVWGYDLINEPTQSLPSPPGVADFMGTQVLAAQAIRRIDPKTPIFITSGNWGSAEGFRDLYPVDIPNVIYQVHFYSPHAFTHQGVYDNNATSVAYPGTIGGVEWNKDRIRKELAPVREFQLAYNVHIYVGEFSAIRWAPGAENYLRDCIEVFEEYGWDWSYHAFREWDGWSLEHSDDRSGGAPSAKPTARKKLMLEWFAKNRRATMP